MKCTREFAPVTITLESQDEIDLLHALLGGADGNYANDFLYRLYDKLHGASISKFEQYWTGQFSRIK